MSKQDFLNTLRVRLSGLPKADIEERLIFYSEIIDDKIEEGLTEEEAVADVGDVMQIADQILSDSNIGLKEKRTKFINSIIEKKNSSEQIVEILQGKINEGK